MNTDQRENLSNSVDSLCEALNDAWALFYLLQGLHEGSRVNPAGLRRFGWFFDRTWTAIYESFFAKVGTLVDGTKGAHSLPNLVRLSRRYLPPEKRTHLPKVEQLLSDSDGPFAKFKKWRNEAIAHRTSATREQTFYADNKMDLPEVHQALSELERLLNQVSVLTIAVHTEIRPASKDLVTQGRDLLACIPPVREGA